MDLTRLSGLRACAVSIRAGVALLVAISLFSTVNYVQYLGVVKEKQQLSENVNQISNKLTILLSEKKDLIDQISDKMPVLEDEREGLIKKQINIIGYVDFVCNKKRDLQRFFRWFFI